MRSKTVGAIIYCGGLAAEMLVALAWWWRPEHRMTWAILAACVFLIAAIVDYGSRR
ncbi:MAG: hypothetical protein AB7T06_37295 [Kofleriaceae bacterium]